MQPWIYHFFTLTLSEDSGSATDNTLYELHNNVTKTSNYCIPRVCQFKIRY